MFVSSFFIFCYFQVWLSCRSLLAALTRQEEIVCVSYSNLFIMLKYSIQEPQQEVLLFLEEKWEYLVLHKEVQLHSVYVSTRNF